MAKSKQAIVKEQVAEAKSSFVPSTGNESYLQPDKKGIIESALVDLKNKIELDYADGMGLAQRATERMISCGKLLLQARERFKGDKEFGQWRAKELSISSSHVSRLMAVAREFGDNEDAKLLPVGTLSELISASPELKKETIDKAKSGEKVTRAEVTKAKKIEKGEVAPPPEEDNTTKATKPVRVNTAPSKGRNLEPWEIAQTILDKRIHQRLAEVEVRGDDNAQINAFIIYGFAPYCEGMPSRDSVMAVYDKSVDAIDDEDLLDKFQTAYDIIMEMY